MKRSERTLSYETFIPVAAERGYEVTKEELDALNEAMLSELSEEELGKVAGGSCVGIGASIIASLIGVSTVATVTVTVGTAAKIFG